MGQALFYAKQAQLMGEVPVGAVVIQKNKIIAAAYNQTITSCDPSAHAEIQALRQAAQQQQNHRLVDVTLYVTLEPCLMCLGAMIQARIQRLVFGAYDTRLGILSKKKSLLQDINLNHRFQITGGILEKETAQLLKDFFLQRR
jgi:tRNA(adenine34) deaminase